jgi:hypothetical protein
MGIGKNNSLKAVSSTLVTDRIFSVLLIALRCGQEYKGIIFIFIEEWFNP